jgi:hypothetical protein
MAVLRHCESDTVQEHKEHDCDKLSYSFGRMCCYSLYKYVRCNITHSAITCHVSVCLLTIFLSPICPPWVHSLSRLYCNDSPFVSAIEGDVITLVVSYHGGSHHTNSWMAEECHLLGCDAV